MSEVISEINKSGIMIVKLNRPESLNSLNYGLVTGVIEAFDEASSNEKVRAVILTGEGRGFCSGADLSGGGWPTEPEWSTGEISAKNMEFYLNPMIKKIVNCPKPVVNAINGIAAGGGVGLALSGDILIAAKSARFKLVFGKQLGIISDVENNKSPVPGSRIGRFSSEPVNMTKKYSRKKFSSQNASIERFRG